MLTLIFFIYLFISILLLVLGSLALVKNNQGKLNKIFFIFCLNLTFWIFTNFFSNNSEISLGAARVANHAVLFFGGLSLFYLLRFVLVLGDVSFTKYDKLISLTGVGVYVTALTPLVVQEISWDKTVYAIQFGPLGNIYFLALGLNALLIFAALYKGIRKNKGEARSRLYTVLWSLAGWLIIIMATNVILPLFSGSFNLTNLGPLASAALAIGLFYSIARHRLFDIRLIIARSVTYILLLSTLTGIYALNIIFIANQIFEENPFWQQATPLIAAFFIAFTISYFKRFFDRVTNDIFYRDSYDPQEFLDRLNKTIITNIELGILLRRAASVIEEYMKSQYVVFGIYSNQDMTYRVVGTETRAYTSTELQTISEGFEKLQGRVITTDSLDGSQALMHKILTNNDISVAVRLSSVLDSDNHTTGYLFLGHKKSGNTYNKQDLRMIEIVADELVIAVQNSLRFEEIQQFNVTLQNRINQATTKVKKSNEKLQALDQTKDDFISMASHQLRTPLTSMKGYISMVLDEDVGPINDNQRRMLQQAFISSQRMTYLISDLLNLSRLKTGKFVMDMAPVNLAHIITQEVEQLKESAHSRNLMLDFDPPKEFPELDLDETKTRQVIMNFLDNAIYYTPDGGKIVVELTEKAKNIEFTVHDTGIGVPKSQQHHLFSKFYRAPNAKQTRPDGTGLGLYMAKKVVVGQGGAVIFRSSEGKGSTFGFTFPKHNRSVQAKVDDSDD